MYDIESNDSHLLVKFKDNFTLCTIQAVIHHVTTLREYPHTNDIWLIGPHRANIRLGELDTMVHEFLSRCPHNATRTKTAVVADLGLTQSILKLWVDAIKRRVHFDVRIFHSLEDAKMWLGIETEYAS